MHKNIAEPPRARDYVWLTAIVLLALVLRALTANGPLWYDEIVTVVTHLRLPWSEMMDGYQMNHHYLFSFQAKLATMFWGEEAWVIRLPAILFGVAAIVATWVLARDIAGTKIAHLTALLLAIAFHHIWFSTNARGYTELQFWSALGLIFYLRGLTNPRPVLWIGFAITLALAVFTHLTGAFFFFAAGVIWVGLVVIWAARGEAQRERLIWPALGFVLGGVLTLLLYAPLLPSVFETVGGVGETSAVDAMQEYQNPVWTVIEAVRTGIGSLGPLVAAFALAAITLVVMGAVKSHATAPAFAPVVIGHIVLTMLLLSIVGMRIWPRFFFVDIGFLMLLIVLGVRMASEIGARILGNAVRPGTLFSLAAVAMIGLSLVLAVRNYTMPKQDFVRAYETVTETAAAEDRVYTVGVVDIIFERYFEAGWGSIRTDEDLVAAVSEPGPMWLVVAFPARTFRDVDWLNEAVDAEFELVLEAPGSLGDGTVLVYHRGG